MSEFTRCARNDRPLHKHKPKVFYTSSHADNILVKIAPDLNQLLTGLIETDHRTICHYRPTIYRMCTVLKQDGTKLHISFSPGLKFHVIYLQECSGFYGLHPQNPCHGFVTWLHWGSSVPRPMTWAQILPSRSAVVSDCSSKILLKMVNRNKRCCTDKCGSVSFFFVWGHSVYLMADRMVIQ